MTSNQTPTGKQFGVLNVLENAKAASPDAGYPAKARTIVNRTSFEKAYTYISSWPGYSPTPLVDLPGLAGKIGVGSLFYKDEGFRFGLDSFKALGGAYATQRLLMNIIQESNPDAGIGISDLLEGRFREITKTVTVACATDGNHGRSVAWGAQTFGCRCIIYIHGGVSEGRKKAIEAYGATVHRVDGDYDDSVRQIAAAAAENGWFVVSDTSYEGYLDVPRDVMQGYTVMADEALQQMPNDSLPTHVFLQGGVGGLAGAVCGHYWETLGIERPRIIVVEPDRADCLYQSAQCGKPTPATGDLETMMAGLSCGEISLIAWDILSTGANDFVILPDDLVSPAMRLLADGTGGDTPIVAGESAVAGLAAVLACENDPALTKAFGLGSDSSVLIFGSEGASDPVLYQEIVGQNPENVRTLAG